jgi:hypothetical protein
VSDEAVEVEITPSDAFRDLAQRATMIRGRGAFGTKPNRGTLSRLSQFGAISVHHYDQATEQTTIERVQNVNPILEACKERRLYDADNGFTPSRDFKHVACLPDVVVANLYKKGINIYHPDAWEYVKSMLDGPDWSAWRTSKGKIASRPRREYYRASSGAMRMREHAGS